MDPLVRRRQTQRVVVLLLAALVSATASVHFRPLEDSVATWWPAAAFATAALLAARRRWWPLLALVVGLLTLVANDLGGRPLEVAAVLGLANGAEALVAAAVLRGRGDDVPRLEDTSDHVRLLTAAALGALVMAVVAEGGLALLGRELLTTGPTVLPAHLAASLVLLPLLMLSTRQWRGGPGRAGEAALQVLALVASTTVATTVESGVVALFLVMPLLVWCALRISPALTAAEVAVVAVLLTLADARGTGAVSVLSTTLPGGQPAGGNHVQALIVSLALLAVPTALAAEQRRHLVARLDAERELGATTLDTTAAVILVTSPTGRVERVNATLERLTGWRDADVVGRHLWECDLFPPERRAQARDVFADVSGGSLQALRESDVVTAGGERLRMVWSNSVVTDRDEVVTHVVCTATDVTGERRSSQLVEHLFGSPKAAPMLFLDRDLKVTVCNAAGEQLLGVRAEETVGRPFVELVLPEQRDDMEAALGRGSTTSRETRRAATLDRAWSWRRPDGSVVRLAASVSAVVDAGGRQVGTLVVASDSTRKLAQEEVLQRALETERRAVERLRRLDDAKNDFVSTVSHELRTPTTSIVGYTEMLRDEVAGAVTPQQHDLLEVIARNGMRLIAVANDLLTLAGLESQERTPWQEGGVDLAAVLRQAEDAVTPLLGGRDLEVHFYAPSRGLRVAGDPAHLDRVVVNLLSNAVKFTPDGGRVECRLRRAGREAVLEVSDTGIGIPLAEQAELFTKFFRSSTAQHHAIPGTGLGLSIIHRIVTDHAGTIDVRSAEGSGTAFTVRLPLEHPAAGTSAGSRDGSRREPLSVG